MGSVCVRSVLYPVQVEMLCGVTGERSQSRNRLCYCARLSGRSGVRFADDGSRRASHAALVCRLILRAESALLLEHAYPPRAPFLCLFFLYYEPSALPARCAALLLLARLPAVGWRSTSRTASSACGTSLRWGTTRLGCAPSARTAAMGGVVVRTFCCHGCSPALRIGAFGLLLGTSALFLTGDCMRFYLFLSRTTVSRAGVFR